MACNIAIDRLRAEQLRRAGGPELEPDEVEDGAPGRSRSRRRVPHCATSFGKWTPRQQRAVYIDVRIEGLPQSAAASRYGVVAHRAAAPARCGPAHGVCAQAGLSDAARAQ